MTTYVFDIDGTICSDTKGRYQLAEPLTERISIVNHLFNSGHIIIFQTARGMGSSNNSYIEAYSKWKQLTERQLKEWGVQFHALYFGKPAGDIYVDDKGVNHNDFFTGDYSDFGLSL